MPAWLAWLPVPADGASVGLPSVLPVDGGLGVGDAGPEEAGPEEAGPEEAGVAGLVLLPDADAGAVAPGLAFFAGLGLAVEVWQGEPAGLAAARLLPVALVFALAEAVAVAVAVAVLVALLLAVAVAVLVAEAVPVAEALSLPGGLRLELPLAGLPVAPSLELLPAGEVCELSGGALGFAGLLGLADRGAAAGEDGDGQAVG